MTPHRHTFLVMRRVHERLLRWVQDLMQEAGHDGVRVLPNVSQNEPQGAQVVVLPVSMAPWPKLAEYAPDVPLLSGPVDGTAGVPEPWVALGQLMAEALQRVLPAPDPRARGRQSPLFRLAGAPPALAAWYEARPSTVDEPWIVTQDGVAFGRIPSLSWRRPLTLQAAFLVLASETILPPSGDDAAAASFSVPALSVVNLGVHLERVLTMRVPGVPVDPDLLTFARALATVLDEDAQARAARILDWAAGEQDHRLSLVPMPDLPNGDLASVMRTFDRPMQPVVHLGVRIAVGAFPIFGRGSSPLVQTTLV